ncbi:uncharacterized protein LOC110627182 isoform X2 [Manihot esculenta]|uniref:Uncharacterized protein n=1 Tax=Manihot esculenta TaxID=3983 RepID=A0ACB7GWL5_MANES|nr:uncharacterized protein LOC110627182 isoform X2 [Manihot esculenta]KAG8644747.1 hypothetical protein MANES_11G161050v8 [Manihot esculenta]
MHGEYSHNCHRRIILVYSFHTWRSDVEATTILNTSAFTMSSRANETALFSDVSLLSTLNLRASPFVGRAFERSGKFRLKQMLGGNHFREWIEFHKNTVKFCCTRLHSSRNSYFLLYANNFIKWSCTLHKLLGGILLLLLQRQCFPIYSCSNSKFKVALRMLRQKSDLRC